MQNIAGFPEALRLMSGSSTWARTRDLRINSQYKPDFLGRYGTSWDEIKPF